MDAVNPWLTWTCTDQNDCNNCVGNTCFAMTLTVSAKETVSDLTPVSDCKYGDSVKGMYQLSGSIDLSEFVVIGKRPGNFGSTHSFLIFNPIKIEKIKAFRIQYILCNLYATNLTLLSFQNLNAQILIQHGITMVAQEAQAIFS